MAGRISELDKIENGPEKLAELYIRGVKREVLAREFGVHKDTISNWVHRPDVQAHVQRLNRERINRIVSKVDAELERRLEKVKDMDIEDIIRLRKEMLPHRIEVTEKVDEASAVEELMTWFMERVTEETLDADEPGEVPSSSVG